MILLLPFNDFLFYLVELAAKQNLNIACGRFVLTFLN